jgi:hypothetical protein
MKTIKTLAELKKLSNDKTFECAILLYGGLFSRKYITYDGKHFHIENCIDNTSQKLNAKQLMDKDYTNIGYALEKGALVIIDK